jgi:hypothetical protein
MKSFCWISANGTTIRPFICKYVAVELFDFWRASDFDISPHSSTAGGHSTSNEINIPNVLPIQNYFRV